MCMEAVLLLECWEQQVDEIVALQATLQEDVRIHSVRMPGISPDQADAVLEGTLGLGDLAVDEQAVALALANGEAAEAAPCIELQLLVSPELPATGLRVELHSQSGSASGAAEPAESGSQDPNGFMLHHLPPVSLTVRTGYDYPARRPPALELEATWLTYGQLSTACDSLRCLWHNSGPGCPVLYEWADWLRHDLLPELAIRSSLRLTPACGAIARRRGATGDQGSSDGEPDCAAGERVGSSSECAESDEAGNATVDSLYMHLVEHEVAARQAAFEESIVTCPVCFDERLGKQCRTLPCSHHACVGCLRAGCSIAVRDGDLAALRCPQPDCKQPLPAYVLQDMLTEAEYARWDELSLARGLAAMLDVVYCPRCSTAAVEQDELAQCPACFFAFCTMCMGSWHAGVQCLTPEERLRYLESRANLRADEARAVHLKRMELQSEAVVATISKRCPVCKGAIQKTSGCNKMTCGYCGTFMCWICGQTIAGYDHFKSGSCVLFNEQEVIAWQARWNAMVRDFGADEEPAGERRRAHPAWAWHESACCPGCGQRNRRVARNNHVRCQYCYHAFCFVCKASLRGRGAVGRHFGPSGCPQHSALAS